MHARLVELSPLLEPDVAQAELSSAQLRIEEVAGMQEDAAAKLARLLKHMPDQQFDLPALVWRRIATQLPSDILTAVQSSGDLATAPVGDDDADADDADAEMADPSDLANPPDSVLGLGAASVPVLKPALDAGDNTGVSLASLKASTSQAALRSAFTHDSALGASLSQQSDAVTLTPVRLDSAPPQRPHRLHVYNFSPLTLPSL